MAAKLILVLAFGFLVTDAYRPIAFTMKRKNTITTENPPTKGYMYENTVTMEKEPPTTVRIAKKKPPQNMDQNELRILDLWRTLSYYLEEQPVIILSEQDVEKQLEYVQDLEQL